MSVEGHYTYPVLDVIQQRWSPRAYADTPVETSKLQSLFEAARWAASSYNEQPWRFIVASKQDHPERYERILSCLVEANQAWAKAAPVLMLTFVSTHFKRNEKPNRVAEHDLGLAMGNLSLQATDLGLVVHQMAGIDFDAVKSTFSPPEGIEPCTAAAIGYAGEPESLSEDWMQDADRAPRTRMDFDDLIFGDAWGEASGLF